ncbi:MAG: HAMP domain-containing histidine kinase [Lachnospiraceae bacterium]|nr:HAMP domain-containing histidine kinase [Lachnospiraceae bacterium]
MTYRIAMDFAILFLVTGLFLVLVLMRIRTGSIAEEYENRAEALIYEMQKGTADEEQLEDACDFLRVVSKENRETVYLAGEEPGKLALGKWYFIKEKDELQVFVRQKLSVVLYGSECSAEFVFECTQEWNVMRRELIFFSLWYLGVAAAAVFVCYVLVRAVLRPIDEMSRQVSRLNLQNLHKERLNEEGSKAELKELAEGINGMLDRMEQAYDAQKQFVSEASHELRTPITVLQGYSSMLKRWGAEDKEVLAESIDAIESEAKSMQDLVEKLLFLSRHERRKLPFAKERFDMAEVIGELEKEMVYMTSTRNMRCSVCEPVRVYGDKQALKQAIRVFLDNAVKYTEEGDTITLSCRNKNGACEITIEDTGLGMKREDLEGIFGRFFRADTVRGKNIEGHGLGLSIARLIIDGHAGKIAVRTQYTKGSCFTVTIPRQRGV